MPAARSVTAWDQLGRAARALQVQVAGYLRGRVVGYRRGRVVADLLAPVVDSQLVPAEVFPRGQAAGFLQVPAVASRLVLEAACPPVRVVACLPDLAAAVRLAPGRILIRGIVQTLTAGDGTRNSSSTRRWLAGA
jgi:hypothetical protein